MCNQSFKFIISEKRISKSEMGYNNVYGNEKNKKHWLCKARNNNQYTTPDDDDLEIVFSTASLPTFCLVFNASTSLR